MSESSPAQQELARWLLNAELDETLEPAAALRGAAERVCQKLSRCLARLITLTGFNALPRALHLARAELAFLDRVRAGEAPGTCLDGLNEELLDVELSRVREWLSAVVAGIIGLLKTFIGEDLALRLIRDMWARSNAGHRGFPGSAG